MSGNPNLFFITLVLRHRAWGPDQIYFTELTIDNSFYHSSWIAKASPRADELRDKIDQAIKELEANGRWEKIYQQYLANGSGLQQ